MQFIDSKLAFGNRWIQVYAKRYKLDSGKEEDFFVIGQKSQIAAILAIDNQEVLLVKQYRWAVEEETLDIPGGGVEVGESPLQAAKRELAEETGYKADEWQLLCSRYLDSGQKDCIQHIFLAQSLSKIEPSGGEDGIKVIKSPINKVRAMIEDVTNGPIESTIAVALAAYLFRDSSASRP